MRRILTLILAMIIVFVGTANVQAGTKEGKKSTYKVTASYSDSGMPKELSYTTEYSDSYFTGSSKKVWPKLAKLSMLASAAAYKSNYSTQLLKDCGFSVKYVSKGVTKNNNDSVSYAIGIKKVENVNIVAVWIKGTSGNYEWVSNFNLGTGKTHKGFLKAEKEMRKGINIYLKEKNITGKIKFWITGHSRGAAVANIYAKNMTDKYGASNVYAYTFATPRVTKLPNKKKYNNIKNFINPGDFVTEVAPKKWKYHRYGKDIILKNRSAMNTQFKHFTGGEYEGYTKAEKNSLVNAFLSYCGKSVKDYYKIKSATGTTPADFCMKGLAITLNSDTGVRISGLKYAADIAAKDEDANLVFEKMIVEGATNNKFRHAHCPTGYICWLESMY